MVLDAPKAASMTSMVALPVGPQCSVLQMREAVERVEGEALPVENELRDRTISHSPVHVEKAPGGAWSANCTAKPIGPPEVKTATRRLGGPAMIRRIAPDTRSRKAGQGSTPLRRRLSSNQRVHRRLEYALELRFSSGDPRACSNSAASALSRGSAGTRCCSTPGASYSFQAYRAGPPATAGQPPENTPPPPARFAPAAAARRKYTSSNRTPLRSQNCASFAACVSPAAVSAALSRWKGCACPCLTSVSVLTVISVPV